MMLVKRKGMEESMETIAYQYDNLPIPGGGYVTGFVYDEGEDNTLYARTDIGGVYRYQRKEQKWKSLIDHVSRKDLRECYPSAVAVDRRKPGSLYVACGINEPQEKGRFAVSEDYGEHFTYYDMPMLVHGNLNGRGAGFRLIIDYSREDTLYYASGQDGLWKTEDGGCTWNKLNVQGEEYMTFIWASENGNVLVCGTAGVTNKEALPEEHRYQDSYGTEVTARRGHSLYISYDGGEGFEEMPQPASIAPNLYRQMNSRMPGLVALRYFKDENYLYVTFSNTGRYSYVVERGYSCDGGDTLDGRVLRYEISESEKRVSYEEITPEKQGKHKETQHLAYGFSGICGCKKKPGLLVCSTITREQGDCVYLSLDYGATWKKILEDLQVGHMEFRSSYMKPEYNGGHSLIHWLSDMKVNPRNPNEAWFNSGTGVFVTNNLLAEEVCFTDWCDGIEETVHLNVYGMPSDGKLSKDKVRVIDIVGDLGGFAFTDITKPCENSFADAEGNRYITCINADYAEENPNIVLATPRGNWKGKTKGGLILSKDMGKTFTRLPMPFGVSERIKMCAENMERPNVNSGWAALSADAKHMVWSMADNIKLPVETIVYTHDEGKTYGKCGIYDKKGQQVKENEQSRMKVFSDRQNSNLFYGFGNDSHMYISKDCGENFYEYEINATFPSMEFGLIDCANQTEIRGESGKGGVFYLATGKAGLWKYSYQQETDTINLVRLTKEGDAVYRVGLGVLRENGDYLTENKALYICGEIDAEYGFYRSFDDGKSFVRINSDRQMYGEINSIDGDCEEFGRFYLATGSRGLLSGAPCRSKK